jgi:hypothetical protein
VVLKSEQLPEAGHVMLKHVAVYCDFNVILSYGEVMNRVA